MNNNVGMLHSDYLSQLVGEADVQYLLIQHEYAKRIVAHCSDLLSGEKLPITDKELSKVYSHLANLFATLAKETESEVQ